MKSTATFENLLRNGGLKATSGRVAILDVLKSRGQTMTVSEIIEKLKGKLNQVTVYRAVEALTKSGLVRRVDLQHPHTHYELVVGRGHHHHVVCDRCGSLEDIENCNTNTLETATLKESKRFNSIRTHSLEFFGICDKCAKLAH